MTNIPLSLWKCCRLNLGPSKCEILSHWDTLFAVYLHIFQLHASLVLALPYRAFCLVKGKLSEFESNKHLLPTFTVTVKAQIESQGYSVEASLGTWVRQAVGWKHYNVHIKGSLEDFRARSAQRTKRGKLIKGWGTSMCEGQNRKDACSLSEGVWQKQSPFWWLGESMFLLLFSGHLCF